MREKFVIWKSDSRGDFFCKGLNLNSDGASKFVRIMENSKQGESTIYALKFLISK